MEKYALLGWPVKHSVSPQMQGAGFRALGIDATYELIEVSPAHLGACVEHLVQAGYAGWNATVPHKEQMAVLVQDIDPGAAAAGRSTRSSTLLAGSRATHRRLRAEQAVAESFGLAVRGSRFLFLGVGGAARATAVHFAAAGAAEITLVNRTVAKATALADRIRWSSPGCLVQAVDLADTPGVNAALGGMDCLIQATSLGLHAGDPLPVAAELLPPGLAVMDMIYGRTPFLQAAAERGCRTADGRGMLLHQGVRSLELWTGRSAPVAAMRAALEGALAARR